MKIYSVLLLMLFLEGCVPNAVTYYRPIVDEGQIVKPHCVPTESIVELNLPDTNGRLHVRAWASNGKYVNQIVLFFSGKEWREIHFASLDFKIRDLDENSTLSATSVTAYKADKIAILTTEPYWAPPERPGLPRFHVQIRSERPLPNNFELLIPTVVVDGEEMKFPVIRFKKEQWMGISPFNC